MNRHYRVVCNASARAWAAMAETAKIRGKQTGTLLLASAALSLLQLLSTPAQADAGLDGSSAYSGYVCTRADATSNRSRLMPNSSGSNATVTGMPVCANGAEQIFP